MNRHLEFYNQCLETGVLPETPATGLCGVATQGLISKKRLEIFEPTDEDRHVLDMEGLSTGWWASGVISNDILFVAEKQLGFTPLRQTIVAFMAVIKLKDFS